MGAAERPPQAHVCTQYAGWGGRMDSPARAARVAHVGFGRGDPPADTSRAGRGRCGWCGGLRAVCGASFSLKQPPFHTCECNGADWSVPSLLVRYQVILKCCIVSGSRPYCKSRRDNLRVTRCAYGMCARTDTSVALTTHSATALQRLPDGKQGEEVTT